MKTEVKWKRRWKNWVAPTKLPGVWLLKDGGYLVRARVTDPMTGQRREIRKVLPDLDETSAYLRLQREVAQAKARGNQAPLQKTLFSDYAVSLLERKLTNKEIKSARGREKWGNTLQHLIAGTAEVSGFGELFIDEIRVGQIEAWKAGIAKLIATKRYSPVTANGWLTILFVVLRTAVREFDLEHDPTNGVRAFDTSEHPTYTDEEPNSLTEDEVGAFLDCMFDNFPQHFAMTYLGFATGLRPSSMRPLRRKGKTPDVQWEENVILIRRSHSLGEDVMKTTKTNVKQRINAPPELMAVLRWHEKTQLKTQEQKDSELLFPTELGGFRGANCLQKPFRACAKAAGLGKRFTPRGLRRTFNDLARRAKLESLVIKSVSGHLTDKMKEHYSTVGDEEQREGIGRVLSRVKTESVAIATKGSGSTSPPPGAGVPSGEEG